MYMSGIIEIGLKYPPISNTNFETTLGLPICGDRVSCIELLRNKVHSMSDSKNEYIFNDKHNVEYTDDDLR